MMVEVHRTVETSADAVERTKKGHLEMVELEVDRALDCIAKAAERGVWETDVSTLDRFFDDVSAALRHRGFRVERGSDDAFRPTVVLLISWGPK